MERKSWVSESTLPRPLQKLCFCLHLLNADIYQTMQCFGLGFKCETQASKGWQGWYYTLFTIFFASFSLNFVCHLLSGICCCVTGAWTRRWRCGSNYQESLICYNQKETKMKFGKSRSECLHALSLDYSRMFWTESNTPSRHILQDR